MSERRDPRVGVERCEPVCGVRIKVDGFGGIRELRRKVGGRVVSRSERVEELGGLVRALDESNVPDKSGPCSLGSDGVEELRAGGKGKERRVRNGSSAGAKKRKRTVGHWTAIMASAVEN